MLKKSVHGFFNNGLSEVNSVKPHKLLDFQVSQFGNPSMDCLAGCFFDNLPDHAVNQACSRPAADKFPDQLIRTARLRRGRLNWMKTGAFLEEGTIWFRVWAPKAGEVKLVISAPGPSRIIKMNREDFGYWSVSYSEAGAGARYAFLVDGVERADPASHFQPLGVEGPSECVDHCAFLWNDGGWEGIEPAQMVIYEIHAGAFTPEGDLDAIIPRLDDLRDLGVNAIELMPVAQFPGSRNWGYDGVFPFSVQNTYGGPDALKRLVNACHRTGISVILDVVYNHFGPEGNYISEFGPYLNDRYKTPWGAALNFDGPQSDHVRDFFIENALHWFENYHLDGLRLDAVHAIIDMSANPFLKELKKKIARHSFEKGRTFYLFAESDLNDTKVVCSGEYAYGLDALWCDDFHHSVHALMTGEREGYYADFGRASDLVKSLRDGYVYTGQYSAYRERSFGSPSAHIPRERFIVFTQNHDQTGNRLLGERLSNLTSFEGLKLSAGILLLSPYIPLLFMGEEYGEEAPFLYFVSHSDKGLTDAIREGRKREFAEFNWKAEPPAPERPETFRSSKINWNSRLEGRNNILLNLYRTLIRIRREVRSLDMSGGGIVDSWCLEDERVVLLSRQTEGGGAFAAFNFNKNAVRVNYPLPQGRWALALDSSGAEWDGPGSILPGVSGTEQEIELNPLSFALYLKERSFG